MICFETAAFNVWAGKASKVMRHSGRIGGKIGLLALIGAAAWCLFNALGLSTAIVAELEAGTSARYAGWVFLLVYVILLAIPFVPSAEIGLGVMLALGASMAIPIYAATILGLSIAFATGRLTHHYRFGNVGHGAPQSSDILPALHERFRERPVLHRVLRCRGLAVIVMINMPGNTVLGGGGGIAMAVGYSRALTAPAFIACAAVAVAPVPALFLLADIIGLEGWGRAWLGRLS